MRLLKASALMVVLLFSAVLMLGVLSVRGLPARGGGGTPGASLNGDVNCDGKVDIADAIAIIQWQFTGGTAPCALAQDNFATTEDLKALAARVDALATSAKKMGTFATGTYIGDGQASRTITTGLSGKLRNVQITPEGNESHPNEERLDVQRPEDLDGIDFSGTDFILARDARLISTVNRAGVRYFWMAVSTSE